MGETSSAVVVALAAVLVTLQASLLAGFVLVASPLGRLTTAARQVAAGDLDVALPHRGGRLAGAIEAFNEMAAALRQRTQDNADARAQLLGVTSRAQALATISVLLSGAATTLEELSRTVTELVTELVGDGASLRLYLDDGTLGPGCSHHRDPRAAALLARTTQRPQPTGNALYQRVLAGETVVVNDDPMHKVLRHADPSARPSYQQMGIGAIMIVPVHARRHPLGTLAMFRGEGRPFTTGEIALVQEIATRAGLALLSARLVSELTSEIAGRREAQEATQRALTRQRELLVRIEQIGRDERRHIAADIHDDAVQVMSTALMRTGLARLQADGELAERLEATEQMVSDSIRRLRSMIFQLAPPDLAVIGLDRALRRLAADLFEGSTVSVAVDVRCRTSDPRVNETTFRIVREALINLRRHARASQASVVVRRSKGGLAGRVSDDGVGFGPDQAVKTGHYGTSAMAERAEAVGGWLRIRPRREGTAVSFWLPLAEETRATEVVASSAVGQAPLAPLPH